MIKAEDVVLVVSEVLGRVRRLGMKERDRRHEASARSLKYLVASVTLAAAATTVREAKAKSKTRKVFKRGYKK